MWPDSLSLSVSRESLDKLKVYHALLLKWQKAINLISPKTIQDAWVRHFADSIQIESYVSHETKTVVDLGSGAGFPGLVLAIVRPTLRVHLVESDERKCQFLRTVSRETSVDVAVHNQRIEAGLEGIIPDVVTARALAELSLLLDYIRPWVEQNPHLECIFLKGVQAQDEIEVARSAYSFDFELIPSKTDPSGCIVRLWNIVPKSGV